MRQLFTIAVLAVLAIAAELLSGCSPVERPDVDGAVAEAKERIAEDTPSGDSIPEPVGSSVEPSEAKQPTPLAADSISPACCCESCECSPCVCGVAEPEPEPVSTAVTPAGVKTEGEATPGPTRELVIIGAAWCAPCGPVHNAADGLDGIRFLDLDLDADEVARLWQGATPSVVDDFGRLMPPSLPTFIQLDNGVPTRRFIAQEGDSFDARRIAYMRDYVGPRDPVRISAPSQPARVYRPQPVRRFFSMFAR